MCFEHQLNANTDRYESHFQVAYSLGGKYDMHINDKLKNKTCRSKMDDNNSTRARREEMEIYCFNFLILYVKYYNNIT